MASIWLSGGFGYWMQSIWHGVSWYLGNPIRDFYSSDYPGTNEEGAIASDCKHYSHFLLQEVFSYCRVL